MSGAGLFGRLKGAVIGMVHVAALPGTPRSSLPLTQIIDQACQEAEVYRDAGVAKHPQLPQPLPTALVLQSLLQPRCSSLDPLQHLNIFPELRSPEQLKLPKLDYHQLLRIKSIERDGLIIENMHDVPYTLCPGPEVTAALAVVGAAVRQSCPRLALGVQVLSAANRPALAVALAAGLDFIRAEGFVFSHVADEGIINACAGDLLRYRKQIGAENIQIFADIKKKHSAHALTADVSVAQTAEAAQLFLADGVVLTGTATGLPTDPRELQEVKHAVKIPVLIGSGVTLENVRNYLDASALIIGSGGNAELCQLPSNHL
ncbi:uncharacterized protein F13E9.13, mitochondrial-like isoform X2 [Pithys albifrons albifrons]|uniref:uncharacterized protein F13E9.13, mitochondrial-like isoform X2 n=1 Tax=Pithys albifrons albifrons TaxID=3385563 RepID=UPI003A5CC500